MAYDDINANVVLTANTQQYDQAMQQSAAQTDQLTQSVDRVSTKIGDITRSAGRKLVGIGLLDAGAITAGTAAWAAYEKQMVNLKSQAEVMTRVTTAQSNSMNTYRKSVTALRSEFGTTTSSAALLTQTLAKMSDGTKAIQPLAVTFSKLSKATGEDTQTLAQSLLNLQKIMGTPQTETRRYADQLTQLAASANTTAAGLADFSSQIAPIGRQIGLTQTEVTGISKAFIKAGQDGYGAATAFTRMMSDISYATQSGSPDLAKYANLIGVTVNQFKAMSGVEKITSIFETLNQMGPRAITELNRMGLDGARTIRAITAMSQQTGGLGASIQEARESFGGGATQRGSAAAESGLTVQLSKIREEAGMTAEAFGSVFGPAVTKVTKGFADMAKSVREVAEGPLGKLVGAFAGLAATISTLGGGLLLAAPLMMKFAGLLAIPRSSMGFGVREGFRGGSRIIGDAATGQFGPDEGRVLGEQGMLIAGSGGTWMQRGAYNLGQPIGAGVHRAGAAFQRWANLGAGRRLFGPGAIEGGPGVVSRFAAMPFYALAGLNRIVATGYEPGYLRSPTDRTAWARSPHTPWSPWRSIPDEFVGRVRQANLAELSAQEGVSRARGVVWSASQAGDPKALQRAQAEERQAHQNLAAIQQNRRALADEINARRESTTGLKENTKAFGGVTAGARSFGRSVFGPRGLAAGVTGTAFTGARMAGGALSTLLGGPMGMTMLGAFIGAPMIMDALKKWSVPEGKFTDYTRFGQPYAQAGGVNLPSPFTPSSTAGRNATRRNTRWASGEDIAFATSGQYRPTNRQIKGMNPSQIVALMSSDWADLRQSPQSRQAFIRDLAYYGRSETEINDILRRLDSGEQGSLGTFASNLSNLYNPDPGLTMSRTLSFIERRWQQEARTIGTSAATQRGVRRLGRGLDWLTTGDPSQFHREVTGTRQSRPGYRLAGWLGLGRAPNREALQAFADRSLGGINISREQAQRLFYGNLPITSQTPERWTPPGWEGQDPHGGQVIPGGMGTEAPGYTEKGPETRLQERKWVSLLQSRDPAKQAKGIQYLMLNLQREFRGDKGEYTKATRDLLRDYHITDVSNIEKPGSQQTLTEIKDSLTKRDADLRESNEKMADRFDKLSDRLPDGVGEAMAKSLRTGVLGRAVRLEGNIGLEQRAVSRVWEMGQIGAQGSPIQALRTLQGMQQMYQGADKDRAYQIIEAAKNMQNYQIDMRQQWAKSGESFVMELAQQQAVINNPDKNEKQRTKATMAAGQAILQQGLMIREQLKQREMFEIHMRDAQQDFQQQLAWAEQDYQRQRKWAMQDFYRSQKWAQQDFEISRKRAEIEYQIMRGRAIYDYNLSMQRAQHDFHLQRKREEQDYHHSVMLMIEERSKSMMDIYQRVPVQQTSSAGWLLYNARDQLRRMREQEANLETLRRRGMTDNTIQQLGLTDPNKAQQLARLVADTSKDPKLVRQFNEQVAERLKAAAKLTKDESSTEWQEFQRQYRLNRDRASDDFKRDVARSHQDFKRQLRQMEDDFRRSMRQQADDHYRNQQRNREMFATTMERSAEQYAISVERMRVQFNKTMRRAERDMNKMAETISGNIKEVFRKGTRELTGEQQEQSRIALRGLNTFLRHSGRSTRSWLRFLNDAFDANLDIPDMPAPVEGDGGGGGGGSNSNPGGAGSAAGGTGGLPITGPGGSYGAASGGVLPGYTPGQDVHHFIHKGTGQEIALSGGESIMVPEWTRAVGGEPYVQQQNALARSGQLPQQKFAKGGVTDIPDEADVVGSRATAKLRSIHRGKDGTGDLIDKRVWQLAESGHLNVPAYLYGTQLGDIGWFADGGVLSQAALDRAKRFAQNQAGKPYHWGYEGPAEYDCSGFMSAITNVIRNQYAYRRLGDTSSFPWAGFRNGWGQFTIGNLPGVHMSGTLDGLNVESTDGSVRVGSAARGAGNSLYTMRYHLGSETAPQGGGGGGGAGYAATPITFQSVVDQWKQSEAYKAMVEQADQTKVFTANMKDGKTFSDVWTRHLIRDYMRPQWRKMVDEYGQPYSGGWGGSVSTGGGSGAAAVGRALLSAGFSKTAAAGIMGNMQVETMGTFSPHIVQGGGYMDRPNTSAGYGLVQWTPGTKLKGYIGNAKATIANEVAAIRDQLAGRGSSPEGTAGAALRAAGSPEAAALAFETKYERHAGGVQPVRQSNARHWFGTLDQGGVLKRIGSFDKNTLQPERVLSPRQTESFEQMVDVLEKFSTGQTSRAINVHRDTPMMGSNNVVTYNVDRSTTFTGDISIQAQDPNELINKLKARQRTQALSQPVLAGAR